MINIQLIQKLARVLTSADFYSGVSLEYFLIICNFTFE